MKKVGSGPHLDGGLACVCVWGGGVEGREAFQWSGTCAAQTCPEPRESPV